VVLLCVDCGEMETLVSSGSPPKRHIDKKPSLFIDKKEKRHKEIEQSLKL
jgi:hypothetical protein